MVLILSRTLTSRPPPLLIPPKVVDFGFAKVVEDRTFTVCGTPEYLAPETIRRAGHNYAVDWWALGVLLYELITGRSPFHGGSQMDVLTRIVVGKVPYDKLLSAKAWSMSTPNVPLEPTTVLSPLILTNHATSLNPHSSPLTPSLTFQPSLQPPTCWRWTPSGGWAPVSVADVQCASIPSSPHTSTWTSWRHES